MAITNQEYFGVRLKFALDHSGLTKFQLRDLAALPLLTIESELNNTDRFPAVLVAPQLETLCGILGVKWAWLVEGEITPAGEAAVARMRSLARGTFNDAEMATVCTLLEAIN